jgi:hypothetical protein
MGEIAARTPLSRIDNPERYLAELLIEPEPYRAQINRQTSH